MVMLALYVDENTYTDKDGNVTWEESKILPLRPPKRVNSGHAVTAYAYDKDYIYWQNSWGTEWGRKGVGYFKKEYEPYIYEAWTLVDLSNQEIIDLKKKLELKVSLYQRLIELWKQLLMLK